MKVRSMAALAACSMVTVITLGFVAGGATVSTVQAAEVDGPKVKWLLSTWGKRRGITEGIESLSEEISKATDGNFEISLQYGGVLSAPKENLDGLKIGAFEAAMFCPVYHPSKTPALGVLDLPFLPITDLKTREKVHEIYLHNPIVLKELAGWNAVPIMSALMPNYEIMGRGDAPESLEDWKGMRLHAAGGMGAVMRSIGATTITVPAPELYQSMERNVIDAVANPYTYAFAAYKLDEISTWRTVKSPLGSLTCGIVANKDAYDALPQQYKDLIDRVKPIAYQHQIDTYLGIDAKNEKQFDDNGLKSVQFSEQDIETIKKTAVQPAWDAWVSDRNAEGLPGQELLDSVLNAAKEVSQN